MAVVCGWLVLSHEPAGALPRRPTPHPSQPPPSLCREGASVTQLASGSPSSTTGGRGGACGPRRLHNRLSGRSAAQPFWTVAATQRSCQLGFMHGLVTFMKGAVFTSQGLLFGTSVKLCDSAFAITAVASSPASCRTSMRHLQLASATGLAGIAQRGWRQARLDLQLSQRMFAGCLLHGYLI